VEGDYLGSFKSIFGLEIYVERLRKIKKNFSLKNLPVFFQTQHKDSWRNSKFFCFRTPKDKIFLYNTLVIYLNLLRKLCSHLSCFDLRSDLEESLDWKYECECTVRREIRLLWRFRYFDLRFISC